MKILVTGSGGFIGKNLVCGLKNRGFGEICEFTRKNSPDDLLSFTRDCDFVFHIAGENRPSDIKDYMAVNAGLTQKLIAALSENENPAPILFSSSVQAKAAENSVSAAFMNADGSEKGKSASEGIRPAQYPANEYAKSKLAAERALFKYGRDFSTPVYIYRLPNVFGKWARPNYNSAVATFCHNIARDMPIRIDDPEKTLSLVYIDDVVEEFIGAMSTYLDENFDRASKSSREDEISLLPYPPSLIYKRKLGDIAALIQSFRDSRRDLSVPDMSDEFTYKLYSTYLSYLPEGGFSYPLSMHTDQRGSFTEFLKTPDRGQVSINISHPGITKGQHWHNSKNEKFLVVKGRGVIRFRRVGESEVSEYRVSGESLQVVDIPTGYTHCIINEGDEDMVTLMWANETFDEAHPDTYYEEV